MIATRIDVLLSQSKINKLDYMKIIFVAINETRESTHYIIQFHIIVSVPSLVYDLNLVKNLKADFVSASWRKRFISSKKMVLKRVTELFQNGEGPNLLVKSY